MSDKTAQLIKKCILIELSIHEQEIQDIQTEGEQPGKDRLAWS